MKPFRLVIAQAVREVITHLPPQLKHKVKAALQSLADNPYQAKALKDDLQGLRSFRITSSRVILRIDGSKVEVVAFGPRRNIYERAATELRQKTTLPYKVEVVAFGPRRNIYERAATELRQKTTLPEKD